MASISRVACALLVALCMSGAMPNVLRSEHQQTDDAADGKVCALL